MSSSSKSTSSSSDDDAELRRGPWTLEEDTVLSQYISSHGEGRWNLLAKRSGLKRTGKSCRLRWLNYLKPDVKRGNLTPEEQLLILELHSKWGNRWSKIAQHLPGRTDNEIKNYWRTRVQKQARHLKIDTNSTEFREIVRRLWMPRLLQKAKESSSSPMSLQHQPFPLPLDTAFSQDSSMETTPTPVPFQGTCINEAYMNSWYQSEQNSDSEHNNSSYMSSSESANIPFGYNNSTGQFHALDYFGNSNVDFDMETFNLETMEYPVGDDSHAAETSWVDNDFACNMWGMDELWQFRNFQK